MGKVPNISFGVVILAAGESSRMGRPKLLLSWGNTSILGSLIARWRSLGARQIAVVRAGDTSPIQSELRRLEFPVENEIVNPEPSRGMFSSIQCAACWQGWQSALTHWVILLGDQPHLRESTLATLMDFAGRNPTAICQPSRAGHFRHPVVLPESAFKSLSNTKFETLSQFLKESGMERRSVEIDDPGLELDIDYPEDYERAKELVFNTNGDIRISGS